MRKSLTKIIASVLLCVSFVLSVSACNKDKNNSSSGGGSGETTISLHKNIAVKTDKKIVDGGKTDYKIIIPSDADENIKLAAEETAYFIEQSSGVKLETATDKADGKYISFGETTAYKNSKLYKSREKDKETVGTNGYMVRTEGENVYVTGESFGLLNGAYGLLGALCGYKFYSSDEISLSHEKQIYLYNFDVCEVPDFEYRIVPHGFQKKDPRRYRMHLLEDIWANRSIYCHNTLKYVDPEEYKDGHSAWFSTSGDQLCYTAHGNDKERKALVKLVATKMVAALEAAPDKYVVGFTQMDNKHACECDACIESFDTYGADSAAVIKFCNETAAEMRNIFAAKGVSRDFKLVFFAYEAYENAPVIEKNGKRVAADKSLICDDNVSVFYAPIAMKYTVPMDSDKYEGKNLRFLQTFKDWQILCDDVFVWIYSSNFSHYLVTYNVFDSMQANLKIFKDLGAKYMQDLGQYNVSSSCVWTNLTGYLQSELQWNCSLDYNKLVDDYFENYFKTAAKEMREVFNMQMQRMRVIRDEELADGSCYEESENTECYPEEFLKTCIDKITAAYSKAEALKSDKETYDKVVERIKLESISYRFLYLKLYGKSYDGTDVSALKTSFVADMKELGLKRYSEHIVFDDKSWQ